MGIWVEVDRSIFERYLSLFQVDGFEEPPFPGKLANALPPYAADSLGAGVLVQLGSSAHRPSAIVAAHVVSPLATDQRTGLSSARYHEILAAIQTR